MNNDFDNIEILISPRLMILMAVDIIETEAQWVETTQIVTRKCDGNDMPVKSGMWQIEPTNKNRRSEDNEKSNHDDAYVVGYRKLC